MSPRSPTWHLWIDETPRPGWQNMSLDMSLHARAVASGSAYLRFYRWDPACLSFGCHEPATRRYDRDRITSLGLDTVRRPTGGRAVWHAGELTYAVAAPEAALGSLREAYHRIHQTIATALLALGAPVQLAPARRMPTLDAGACFGSSAGGEVVHESGKVVGSAQLRSQGALLQHGSVLLTDDQSRLADVTTGQATQPAVAPVSRILQRRVEWEELAHATAAAARGWGDPWVSLEDQVELVIAEAAVLAPRFRDPAWTWQR